VNKDITGNSKKYTEKAESADKEHRGKGGFFLHARKELCQDCLNIGEHFGVVGALPVDLTASRAAVEFVEILDRQGL
jgi:hypothetical protein